MATSERTERMRLHTYLNYGGNCEQAFRFYKRHLGGKITMLRDKFGTLLDASSSQTAKRRISRMIPVFARDTPSGASRGADEATTHE